MRRQKSIIWILVMTLGVMTMPVMPISARTTREIAGGVITQSQSIKVGDYLYYGKRGGRDIIWRVVKQDEKGILLFQNDLLRYSETVQNQGDKIDKRRDWKTELEIEDVLDRENILDVEDLLEQQGLKLEDLPSMQSLIEDDDMHMIVTFYLNPNTVVFKLGEGSLEKPYTPYMEWSQVPTLKAKGNQVSMTGVEVIGSQNLWESIPTIWVDGIAQTISNINYNQERQTLTYELAQPIKQNQRVEFAYSLVTHSTSAIAKCDERLVIKEVPVTGIPNETVDNVPQPVVITKQLQEEWWKVGEQRRLSVTAKGEGQLTFSWYKDNKWIGEEKIQVVNQEATSSYAIKQVTTGDAGVYSVEVSGTTGLAKTQAPVHVISQCTIRTATYPADAGNITNNSAGQNGIYNVNDVVTLTANSKSYYQFKNWTENGQEVSRDRTYTFTAAKDRNLVANFYWDRPEPIPQYTIRVTITPKDAGTVRGDYTYNKGDQATVTAKAKDGYVFDCWTEDGDVVSRNESYSFTVKEERRLKVNFEEEKPKEVTFKQAWRALSSRQQKSILENFEAYLPYTTLEESLTLDQLNDLTKGYFTKDQLREVKRDLDLLEDVGIDLDWKVVELKEVSQANFIDLSRNHWAYSNITELAKRGIVTGYPDGSFKPNKALTVEDTFTFLDRVLLLNEQMEVKHSRSVVEKYIENQRSWAFDHVASIGAKLEEKTLRQIGQMEDAYVSRGQLAQVIYEVTNGNLKKIRPSSYFTDTVYSEYEAGIDYCVRTGLLEGTTASTMEPNKAVTRAEMMTILMRLDGALKR
ncbi:MAG: S-layer homology domain-containing protein [Niameybacter sp.]